jgi:hypothetical protein
MKAREKNELLLHRMHCRGIRATWEQVNALRRAELTLQRWGEWECGNGNDYQSWAIERDEKTGKPFMCYYPHTGKARREPIADREAGALRRVAEVCAALGIHYYHQGDPRGCVLWVSVEPIDGSNYSNGVACCL